MHRFVLENGVDRFSAIQKRITRTIEILARERVQHPAICFVGERLNAIAVGPRRDGALRSGGVGIDATGEQLLERRINAWAAERSLDQRVETERRKMAFVEHHRMPKRDGPLQVRIFCQQIE